MVWDHETEGKRIQRLRDKKGLTEDQLAKLTDLSEATIDRIEAGVGRLTPEYRAKFAGVLKVSAEYLQHGDSHSERETSASIAQMLERRELTSAEADELKPMVKAKLRTSNNVRIPLKEREIRVLLDILRFSKGD